LTTTPRRFDPGGAEIQIREVGNPSRPVHGEIGLDAARRAGEDGHTRGRPLDASDLGAQLHRDPELSRPRHELLDQVGVEGLERA
jgi:hypothetical protein